MPDPQRKKRSDAPDPTHEENFPDNPTRRAADREMDEPSNVRPSGDPTPRREARKTEIHDE